MKKFVLLLLALATVICFAACSRGGNEEETSDSDTAEQVSLDYKDINVSDYVKSVTYKGHTVDIEDDETKEDELWEDILDTATIASYPEDKVQYYFNQTKQYYMYLANNDEDQYPTVLKHFDTDEAEMMEEAREIVAKDLVYHYIVATEKLEISETERAQLFDKYVDKYVNDYGYNRDYVTSNMSDLIVDSMLYDKTMEFLMANNKFNVKTATETK